MRVILAVSLVLFSSTAVFAQKVGPTICQKVCHYIEFPIDLDFRYCVPPGISQQKPGDSCACILADPRKVPPWYGAVTLVCVRPSFTYH